MAALRSLATPWGVAITLYALNIVAWGGMLFLLLLNAAPAMCHPSCSDIDSPRRVWIEIDAQILNALFCVTGFGLAPWRARDLFWWAAWRARTRAPCWCSARAAARGTGFGGRWARWWRGGDCRGRGCDGGDVDGDDPLGDAAGNEGLRVLARIHRGWFRLPTPAPTADDKVAAEEDMGDAAAAPARPRAPPTPRWKLDFVVWTAALNSLLQVALASIMWAMDRYTRPSWATGLLVALACLAGAASGGVMFAEQKNVKKIEVGGGAATPELVVTGEEAKGGSGVLV
jgi:hypothetical protein